MAEALGYFNTSKAIRNHVSEDDLKTLKYKAYNVSGEASLWRGNDYSDTTIINESGLYSLLFSMQPQKAHNDGASDAYPIETQQRIEN